MARRWPQVAVIVALLGGWAAPAIALTIERLPAPPEAAARETEARHAVSSDGRWSVTVQSPHGEITLRQEPGVARLVHADQPGAPPGRQVGPAAVDSPPAALTLFPDGSAVTVFAGPDGPLVAYTYRPATATWQPVTTWPGDLKIAPGFSPGLARLDAAVVLLAITTSDDGEPVLSAATSNTAGQRWSNAARISDASSVPAGPPAAVILPNGHVWLAWRDTHGDMVLRLLYGAGQTGDPVRLGPATGDPHLWPEPTPPEVLPRFILSFIGLDGATQFHRITPPAPRFAWTTDCGCDPVTGVVRGHAVRGEILTPQSEPSGFEVRHDEIPGILPAATRVVRVDPRLVDVLAPGQTFLARLERRDDGDWWLFDIRLLRRVSE